MLLFKKEGLCFGSPAAVAPGEEAWEKASDSAEAEPVPPRICSEILEKSASLRWKDKIRDQGALRKLQRSLNVQASESSERFFPFSPSEDSFLY